MRLEGVRCVVRDWCRTDSPDLVRAANNRAVWRNLTHTFPHPYTEEDADAWFAILEGMTERTHWAIEVDGHAVGGIGVTPGEGVFALSGEFGYWLAEPLWGLGIATEAVELTAPYAMAHLGLCRLVAHVYEWNPASMHVLEKCGFVREGVATASVFKDGKVIDEIVYALVDLSAAANNDVKAAGAS